MTPLEILDELAAAEQRVLGLRFIVANDPIQKQYLRAIRGKAEEVIAQAREIMHTCDSRICQGESIDVEVMIDRELEERR